MQKVLLVLSTFVFMACTKHETQVIYQNPPSDILKSLSATNCDVKNCIKLQKSSLNKTFLLIASAKSIAQTPQWLDLKPAVVIFKQTSTQVGLFSLNLDSIYDADESQELMQAFDIVSEDSTSVTFNWGQGFETLRQEDALDIETKLEDGSFRESIRILNSYISTITATTDKVEIIQTSKVQTTQLVAHKTNPFDPKSETKQSLDTKEDSFNVNIQLYPYSANKNFKAKAADASRTVGFFITPTATPSYAQKKQYSIVKWDFTGTRGPVHFLISDNTPANYVEAVKEGILYWNKVLGFEAVTVQAGVDARTVAPLHSVMVRWIPWEDAGFAYAQVQADPLTGEALRGQVYMTPAWIHGKGRGAALAPVINPTSACDFSQLAAEMPQDLPDNAVDLRIAQDRVRGVIAHEVGHSLGLRHNFAGSSSITASAKDILQGLKNYLGDALDLGFMTSTTVMDYIKGGDEVLLGKYIQSKALPYDLMAMKWAYADDDKALDAKVSRYCSDEDIAIALGRNKVDIYDCRRHDAAASPFISLIDDQLKARAKVLQTKYADLLNIIFPVEEPDYVNSLDRILEDNHADLLLKALATQFSYLQSHDKVVSLDKWRNELQRNFTTKKDPALDAMLRDHLDQAGGLAKVKELLTPAPGWTQADLQAVLTLIVAGKGKTKSGRDYELTQAQKDQFAAYFKDEAQYIEVQLGKELNEMFKGL